MFQSFSPFLPPFVALVLGYGLSWFLSKTALAILLADTTGGKKMHQKTTPATGGIAIFVSVFTVTFLFYPWLLEAYPFLFLSLTLIFGLGLLDDLKPLGWLPKLIAQLVIISFVVIAADIRLETLFLETGILRIPQYLSVGISMALLAFGTNAFNFIDGVDGLAALVCMCTLFGILYFLTPFYNPFLYVVCAAVFGFRMLNKAPASLFLGDSGSLFLGLLCTIMLVIFCQADLAIGNYRLDSYAARLPLVVALFWFPVFDTFRVFILRLRAGVSLFERDKRHSYSLLLRMGFSAHSIGLLVFAATLLQVAGVAWLLPITGLWVFLIIQLALWLALHFGLHLQVVGYIQKIKNGR